PSAPAPAPASAPAPTPTPTPVARTIGTSARMAPMTSAGTRTMTGTRVMTAPPPPPKNNAAADMLPKLGTLVALQAYPWGLKPEETSHGARGPAALPVRPFAEVRTEDIDLDLTRVLNLFPEIYPDQEPTSGIFYFLPHSYSLRWDPNEGYELR